MLVIVISRTTNASTLLYYNSNSFELGLLPLVIGETLNNLSKDWQSILKIQEIITMLG